MIRERSISKRDNKKYERWFILERNKMANNKPCAIPALIIMLENILKIYIYKRICSLVLLGIRGICVFNSKFHLLSKLEQYMKSINSLIKKKSHNEFRTVNKNIGLYETHLF